MKTIELIELKEKRVKTLTYIQKTQTDLINLKRIHQHRIDTKNSIAK
jgi:hypothetical protein